MFEKIKALENENTKKEDKIKCLEVKYAKGRLQKIKTENLVNLG